MAEKTLAGNLFEDAARDEMRDKKDETRSLVTDQKTGCP
jgi:hypothetical protein